MTGIHLDLTKQIGDIYNAGITDFCTYNKSTSRMDIVDDSQCGVLTDRIVVAHFGEHRFICANHKTQ